MSFLSSISFNIWHMEKYFFEYKGYNPFEAIDGAIKIIRNQFKIEDELRLADNQDKIKNTIVVSTIVNGKEVYKKRK